MNNLDYKNAYVESKKEIVVYKNGDFIITPYICNSYAIYHRSDFLLNTKSLEKAKLIVDILVSDK